MSYGEIGSEFWDVPAADRDAEIFPAATQWFISGRSALLAIVKELGQAKSVSMPSWCCDSMVKPFVDAGMDVHFYPVYADGKFVQKIDFSSDVLFLMDYFGFCSGSPDLNGYRGKVIRDVTHSIFSATYSDADYYFGSLRKWCGFYTGGFAIGVNHANRTTDQRYVSIRKEAMRQKKDYIEGKTDSKAYLNLFRQAEELLDSCGICGADGRDVEIARKLDVDFIVQSRRKNAKILLDAFSDIAVFREIKENDCPMFVPIMVKNRDALRKKLIENRIYCPIHWPISEYHHIDGPAKKLYDEELSLVCDQRYNEEDMKRMIRVIKEFEGR